MPDFSILLFLLIAVSVLYFFYARKYKTYEEKEIKRAGYFEIKSGELPLKIKYKEESRLAEPWSITKITCFRGKIYDGQLTDEEKEEIKEKSRKGKPRKKSTAKIKKEAAPENLITQMPEAATPPVSMPLSTPQTTPIPTTSPTTQSTPAWKQSLSQQPPIATNTPFQQPKKTQPSDTNQDGKTTTQENTTSQTGNTNFQPFQKNTALPSTNQNQAVNKETSTEEEEDSQGFFGF